MAKRIEVRAIKNATFEGDGWEPVICDETRELLGFHAIGTNCTVFIHPQYTLTPDSDLWPIITEEHFKVPNHGRVYLRDGLIVVPQEEEPPIPGQASVSDKKETV
jgi:hypothetical protein